MKKYIYGLFFALISVAMFTACSADEGTDEGNDSKAKVTLYQYVASAPNDPDVDTQLRISTNSATQEVYLLAEKTENYNAHIKEMGEDGYKNYVVEKGQKVVVIEDLISTGGSVIDVVEALREAGAEVLGIVSIFTYGMKKGIEKLAAADVKNVSLTNLDVIAKVAAETGYIAESDIEKVLKFRDNPSDESWIGKARG